MSHDRKVRECRAKECGQRIFFAKRDDVAGKTIPLNADPDEAGEYVVTAGGVAHKLRPKEEATGLRYRIHFATCKSPEAVIRAPRRAR